jgi:hypothetical protein
MSSFLRLRAIPSLIGPNTLLDTLSSDTRNLLAFPQAGVFNLFQAGVALASTHGLAGR